MGTTQYPSNAVLSQILFDNSIQKKVDTYDAHFFIKEYKVIVTFYFAAAKRLATIDQFTTFQKAAK